MEIYHRLTSLLRKPFPRDESWPSVLRTTTVAGLFVGFFLYFFRPFDMDQVEEHRFWICMGFGGITFLTSILVESTARLLGIYRRSDPYTFGLWIVYMVVLLLAISIANFVYMRMIFFGYILWEYLPYMIRATVAIGVFPIVAIGGLAMVRLEHKYQSIASEISKHSATAVPTPTGDEQTIYDIPVDDIRYIEALQNYAKIVYVGADGTLQHKTERTTMIRLQEQLHGTPVVKCHRSYLVNKTAIKSATGNAQGLQLTLLGCDKQVPVSRSKVPVFRGL